MAMKGKWEERRKERLERAKERRKETWYAIGVDTPTTVTFTAADCASITFVPSYSDMGSYNLPMANKYTGFWIGSIAINRLDNGDPDTTLYQCSRCDFTGERLDMLRHVHNDHPEEF